MIANATLIEMHWADWLVVAAYGAAMFAVAFWALRRIKDCGGFLLGKRKMGKLMMMGTTFAGGTNANHPMAVAAATFKNGLSGMWLSLTWMLITPFFWMYPPVLRRLRVVTLVDLVQHRFGRLMATIFKIVAVIGTPISIGLGIKSAAIVLEVMTGGAISGTWAVLVITLPTVIYSLMGGVIAAYATDVLQGGLIILLSFLLIPFAIAKAGGLGALDSAISDELTHLIASEGGKGFGFWWVFWFMIGILFSAPVSTGGGAGAARNEFAARSQIFGLICKRFCTVGWGLVGLFAIALYSGNQHLVSHPNEVFPVASGDLLPVVLRGLMVASMLAAVMSSLDGMMLSFAGMLVNNFYREYNLSRFVPLPRSRRAGAEGPTPGHYLWAARAFALIGVLAGWWVATGVRSLVDFSTFVEPFNSLTGVAILVALLWRRTTRAGAIASVCVMFPVFFIVNRWELTDGLATLPWGLRDAAQWLVDLYGAVGHDVVIPSGAGAHLPVQIKNPMYLIPGLVTIVVVSRGTRQHDCKAVDEFYARLDTPLGEEGALREAGFRVDDIEGLDGQAPAVDARDHDVSRRLLLPDLLRLPKLLARREAKLADYKWDWIGLLASVAFVVGFIFFIQYIGSLF